MVRTIPLLIHDELNPEDVDSDGEDHAADELRYFLQTLRANKTKEPDKPIEQTASNYVIARLAALKAQKQSDGISQMNYY